MEVFEYNNYKRYLSDRIPASGQSRGQRSKLARFLNCQTGFISQVLNGSSQFSLEHSLRISEFLGHTEKEKSFFMLLVSSEKAGNEELKSFYQQKIDEVLKKRARIKNRVQANSALSKDDYNIYYSQWYYAAIHIIASIEDYKTVDAICEKLNLGKELVTKVTQFLIAKELIKVNEKMYFEISDRRVHLSDNESLISKHHTNWRIEAIKSFEKTQADNFHYSSILSMSKKDYVKIKKQLLSLIENTEQVLVTSPEEELCALNIDFFKY